MFSRLPESQRSGALVARGDYPMPTLPQDLLDSLNDAQSALEAAQTEATQAQEASSDADRARQYADLQLAESNASSIAAQQKALEALEKFKAHFGLTTPPEAPSTPTA